MIPTLYNDQSLEKQASLQRDHTWDLETDISWSRGVDLSKYFLPLDAQSLVFPGLAKEARRTLSQFLGIVVNATIAEMEGVIDRVRDPAWDNLLRRYPVNPEMRELGDLFFAEERKHARAFGRYIETFCATSGVKRESLERLLPKAQGSRFLSVVRANAGQGGFAFWWVVAAVEEVSVQIYQMMHKHEAGIDPLYFQVHRRHLEEEARHKGYAFLMLELAQTSPAGWREKLLRKTDLVLAQTLTAGWVMAELHKVYDARALKDEHPFFASLAQSLEHLAQLKPWEVVRRLFVTAPYVSFVLNTRHQRQTSRFAEKFKVWSLPFPAPKIGKLDTAGAT